MKLNKIRDYSLVVSLPQHDLRMPHSKSCFHYLTSVKQYMLFILQRDYQFCLMNLNILYNFENSCVCDNENYTSVKGITFFDDLND